MLWEGIPCSSPQPLLKDGPFPEQVKADFRVRLQLVFAQRVINQCFYYHFMRFLSPAARSCGLQAHPHPSPEASAPGWRQSCTGRHRSGSRHRHGGGGASAWEQRGGTGPSSAGGRSARGHFSPLPGTVKISSGWSSATLVHSSCGDANLRGGAGR